MQACVHVCWEGVSPRNLRSQEAVLPIIAGSPLCSSGQAEQIPAPGLLRDHCWANSEDGMGKADPRELFILPLARRVPETLQDCGQSTRHPRTYVQSQRPCIGPRDAAGCRHCPQVPQDSLSMS